MNTYTLYWLTGKRETVQGDDPAQAMTLSGYGDGAVRALDFYANGDDRDYEWDAEKRNWVRVTARPIASSSIVRAWDTENRNTVAAVLCG